MAEIPTEVRKKIAKDQKKEGEGELESLQNLFASLLDTGVYENPEELISKGGFDPFEVTLFVSMLEHKNSAPIADKPIVLDAPSNVKTESSQAGPMLTTAEVGKLVDEIRRALEQTDTTLKAALVKNLARALENNTTVLCLDLDDLELNDKDANAIAQLLAKNKFIIYVSLKHNEIGNAGVAAIAKAMEENSTLETLLLGNNRIGDEGALAIANLIQNNKTLRILGLDFNLINKGVMALGIALGRNRESALLSLDLSSNQIQDPQSLRDINHSLESTSKTLAFLNLECNPCRPGLVLLDIERRIANFLNRNCSAVFRSMEQLSRNLEVLADMSASELEKFGGAEKYKDQFSNYKREIELGLKKLRVIAQPMPFANISEKLERLRLQCEAKVTVLTGGGMLSAVAVDEPITTHLAKVPTKLNIDYGDLKFGVPLGEGSFGAVYYGTHLGSPVAIKILKPTTDQRLQEGFLREMEILAGLRSPHVVFLFGIAVRPNGEGYAIVTEFMSRGNLTALLYGKDAPKDLPWQHRLSISRGIICALLFLHHHQIRHRDLKSDNVMLSGDPRDLQVKLIDLGFAKCVEQNSQKFPALQAEGVVGTPLHWSPEILEYIQKGCPKDSQTAQPELSSYEADIWSLGVLLNQIASRKQPYASFNIRSISALISFVLTQDRRDEIPPPPSTPLFFSDNIKSCWNKDPQARLSAAALLDAHDKGVASFKF